MDRAIAAVGGGWNSITPYKRPFSVTDLSISYPYTEESIKTWILIVVGLIAPGIIIFFICLVLVPGPTATANTSRRLIWSRKAWEWNAGWLGLALALATAFTTTQGAKLVFGKPRPHLLSVCRPDLNAIADHAVGSYASGFNAEWVLVSASICQQTDTGLLNDGFKSFPSGHASFSWAGLLYLALYLCSKFAITIPYLSQYPYSQNPAYTAVESQQSSALPLHNGDTEHKTVNGMAENDRNIVAIRNQAAAPPTWTIVLVMIPIFVAIYICSTRYAEFYHFGWDLLAGSLIGIVSAYCSFRMYHLPIARGAGWAWGARSRDRAFGVGVGMLSYVGPEGWSQARSFSRTAPAAGRSSSDNTAV